MNLFLRLFARPALFCFFLFACLLDTRAQENLYRSGVRNGLVKVKFKREFTSALDKFKPVSANMPKTGIVAFDEAAKATRAKGMRRMFPYNPKIEAKLRKHGLHLWYLVELESNSNPLQVVSIYKSLKEVAFAEADHQKVLKPYQAHEYNGGIAPMGAMPFNDPYLSSQWHYENIGQTGYPDGADINLFEAWKSTAGKRDVIVSIHDQGIDVEHPDLAANIWINETEKNGKAGVDDDNNGYVDDIHGWNFDKNTGAIDAEFHGTHVAGTIAAVNGNGLGVAGVAGGTGNNDGVRVMSLQILNGGSAENSYIYAATMGAVVAQNSWGYVNPEDFEQSVLDAIDYFIAEAGDYPGSPMRGGVVFFASGNNNMEEHFYPGYHRGVIAVNSIGPDFMKAPYSNYGSWTDISAPGGNMELGSNYGVLSTLPNNKYGYLEGTSMACPHVSGIAALALSNRTHQLTNNELLNKILTGVVDIEKRNPDYTGKLGTGLIDAARAIQNDQQISPNAVTDLQVTATAQEFVKMQWTVPSDQDDGGPTKFTVYYNTSPITLSTLEQTEKIEVENKLNPGDTFNFEVDSLKSFTKYYFSVTSQDRWGNSSAFSNMADGTTNAGPQIDVDDASKNIVLEIDATVSAQIEKTITLFNNAEGLLRWSYFTRSKDHALSWSSPALKYPVMKQIKSTKPANIWMRPAMNQAKSNGAAVMNFQSVEKNYAYSWPVTMIGETDTTLTNSSATRFVVTEGEGFNLTHVNMWLKSKKTPVIIEIYRGDAPKKKNLVFAQEFIPYTQDDNNYQIQLDEQIYFEKDAIFWIVFHVPSGTIFPLGIGYGIENSFSQNCLMSFDLGNTWTALPELLHDNRFVWTTVAASYNQHLGTYLTLDPASGEIAGNSNASATLKADASTLINGEYHANLIVKSNDANAGELRLPVTLNVSGHKPVLESEQILDYGSVFHGKSKEMTLTINNVGYGNLNSPTLTISDPQFEVIGDAPWQIPARGHAELTIRFNPSKVGNANATLRLESGDIKYSLPLFGVGTAPGKIEVTPVSQTFGNLAIGDSLKAKVTIKNSGDYLLKYFVPGFDTKGISNNWPDPYHKYGYAKHTSLTTDTKPVPFEWNDIASTGTEITSYFRNVDNHYYELGLGFEFPFYKEKMNKVFITPRGMLTFDNTIPLVNYPRLNDPWGPISMISATGGVYKYLNSGKVFYKMETDRLIVQYERVQEESSGGYYTFQIVLFDNGNIRIYYKDISSNDSWVLRYMVALVEDREKEDGILFSNFDTNYPWSDQTAFGLDYPGPDIITSITNGAGLLMPGESSELEIGISTNGLNEGAVNKNISIISNDPFNSASIANIGLNITSGGQPKDVITKSAIDFGQVFQGASKKEQFYVRNEGTATLNLTSVKLENGVYLLSGNSSASILPKRSELYEVTIPTDQLGVLNDKIQITYSSGETNELTITGEIVDAPAITVDLSPIEETLTHGDLKSIPFSVSNTGKATLEVAITGSDWAITDLAEKPISTNSIPDLTYVWRKSGDERGPHFQWNNILAKATKIPLKEMDPFDDSKYWKKVTLPWSFEFYGTKYDTVYVGFNGIISFNPNQPASFWASNIPTNTEPNNFIAPWWGSAGYDDYLNPATSGIFYLAEEDRFIISFERMINVFGMGDPMSVQAILSKNGSIKFQYRKDGVLEQNSNLGVIGVENKEGTEGVELAAYQQLDLSAGLAYLLSPAKKRLLNPGERIDGNIIIDAKNLNAGIYNSAIHISSNAPNRESLDKPITLTVTGDYKIQTTDSIAFGEVMVYQTPTGPATYEQPFTISNEGSATLEMQSLTAESGNPELSVQLLVDGFWGPEWMPVDWLTEIPAITPGGSLQGRLVLTPGGSISEIIDNLTITIDTASYKIPVSAAIVLPPVLKVDTSTIKVAFNLSTETAARNVQFNNLDGASNLKYDLSIDYKRVAKSSLQYGERFGPKNKPRISTNGTHPVTSFSAMDETFNRSLQYDSSSVADSYLGFDGVASFTTATRFNAGPEGFNLSHVQTYFAPGDLKDVTLEIEIRAGGRDITNAVSILKMNKSFSFDSLNTGGALYTIALTESQKIYPNEDFYVVITYPMEISFPQGVHYDVEKKSGRYLFNESGLWYDMQDYPQYSTYGWFVRAGEKTYENSAWVSIKGSNSGTIKPGEEGNIDLEFLTAPVKEGDHKAELVIKSNDPLNTEARVNLHMHMNTAPRFEKLPVVLDTIIENSTTNVDVLAKDTEGDSIAYSIKNAPGWVSLTAVDSIASLTLKPTYSDAGTYAFTLVATDVYQHQSEKEIRVVVKDKNRAPVADSVEKLQLTIGNLLNIPQAEWFSDPDGDSPLQLTIKVDNDFLLQATLAGDKIVLNPLQVGNASLEIIASDGKGGMDTLNVDAMIRANEAPIVEQPIGNIILNLANGTRRISLTQYFSDPENDQLHYEVVSTDNSIVNGSISNNELVLEPLKQGDAPVVIVAKDEFGGQVTQSFIATVVSQGTIEMRNYPNPVRTTTTIEYLIAESGRAVVTMYSSSGIFLKKLVDQQQATGKYKVEVDMNVFPAGIYYYKLSIDGKGSATEKMVKQ